MADEEVGLAVAVQVGNRQAQPEDVVRDTGCGVDVLELEVALVAEEHRLRAAGEFVLDHEEIEEAVAVIVEDADVPRGEERLRAGAAGGGDIDERAAVVAKQDGAAGLGGLLGLVALPAPGLGIVRRVELEGAVVVEIGEDGAAGAGEEFDAGLGETLERAVAPVAQEAAGDRPGGRGVFGVRPVAEAAHEEIEAPVAVHVPPRAAVAHEAGEGLDEAGGFGHVGEDDLPPGSRQEDQEQQEPHHPE